MVDDHQQRLALGLMVVFTVLSGIAIVLRMWSRWLSRTSLTSDDWFILVGYLLSISQSITAWNYIKFNYVGIHIWDIPKDHDATLGRKWNFANQHLYNPALAAVKISILLFLRRLESRSRAVQYLIWGSFAIVGLLFFIVLIVDVFQCQPVQYVYDLSIPGGKCINQGAFYVSSAAINLFTDLMVLSIPVIITVRLQMPIRRKIAVCVILCMGGVATAVGVWRVIVIANAYFSVVEGSDSTYSIGFCSSAIEVNLAVITACGPSMKAISSRFLPRLLGSSRDKSTHGAGTGSGAGVGSRRFHSNIFSKAPVPTLPSIYSRDYEMADPLGGPRVDVVAEFEMRKYKGGDSPSLSSDDGKGIMKRTDITVGYSMETRVGDSRSQEGRPASADSIV